LKDLLEIGRVSKSVGVKGRMKAVSYIESPEALKPFKDVYITCEERDPDLYKVRYINFATKSFSFEFEGVNDIDTARSFVGCRVLIPSDRLRKLPEGEYYWRDIIGLEVFTGDNQKLGKIEKIFQAGSNHIYVCTGGEREILLPAIEDVIKQINLEKRIMIVELLEGL
jgi:16S rRNA processing protein RimM